MLDQRLPHFACVALDKAEDAGMNAASADRCVDRFCDDLAGSGMGVVTLDHDGTARGQCSGCITAGGGEGQREVRRAKDGDRPYRALHHLQVRARQRLSVRQGRIMTLIEIIALQNMACEQPELTHRAAAFTLQPPRRKTCFLRADLRDLVAARLDLVANCIQELRARLARRIAIGPECVFCRDAGAVNQCRRTDPKFMRRAIGRLRVECGLARNPAAGDQMLSVGSE